MADTNDVCTTKCVHGDAVERASKNIAPDEELQDLAEFFKVFGDKTRLKILSALAEEELCVCDLSCITGMSDSAVSHQLRILRNTRLVKYRKEGRIVYYSLDDRHIHRILKQGLDHIQER